MPGSNSIGERLTFARTRAGLKQADVREKTSIGESSLSEFENGKREPSLAHLAQLAELYRLPMSFFLSTEALPKEVVRWRKKPVEGRAEVEAHFLQLCEHYHNLEVWCGSHLEVTLPEVRRPERSFDRDDAEALAKRVRQELGLGDFPAFGLMETLEEQLGLKVFHLAFEPTGTAASTKHPKFGAAVLLNQGNRRWRRNFDLAHELFHLLTWDLFETERSHEHPESEEKLADTFAAALVMPAEAVRATVTARRNAAGKLSLPSLFDIACHCAWT